MPVGEEAEFLTISHHLLAANALRPEGLEEARCTCPRWWACSPGLPFEETA